MDVIKSLLENDDKTLYKVISEAETPEDKQLVMSVLIRKNLIMIRQSLKYILIIVGVSAAISVLNFLMSFMFF